MFGSYLLMYAFVRMITETFRGDVSRGYFLPDLLGSTLSFSQGISLAMAAVAVFWMWRSSRVSPAS